MYLVGQRLLETGQFWPAGHQLLPSTFNGWPCGVAVVQKHEDFAALMHVHVGLNPTTSNYIVQLRSLPPLEATFLQ